MCLDYLLQLTADHTADTLNLRIFKQQCVKCAKSAAVNIYYKQNCCVYVDNMPAVLGTESAGNAFNFFIIFC